MLFGLRQLQVELFDLSPALVAKLRPSLHLRATLGAGDGLWSSLHFCATLITEFRAGEVWRITLWTSRLRAAAAARFVFRLVHRVAHGARHGIANSETCSQTRAGCRAATTCILRRIAHCIDRKSTRLNSSVAQNAH